MPLKTLNKIIAKLTEKALERTGVLTSLITIIALGVGSLVGFASNALPAAIIVFGISGVFEVFHLNRKSDIYRRRQSIYNKDDLFWGFMSHKTKVFQLKIFEEFKYSDMCFKTVGFKEVPSPITIAGPFCPKCGGKLLESVSIKFPGIIAISFDCLCGYSNKSKKTISEIYYEISVFKNLPTNKKMETAKHSYFTP